MKRFKTANKVTPFQIDDVLAKFLAYLVDTLHSDEVLEGVGKCRAVACRHCYVNIFWRVLLAQIRNLYCSFVRCPRIIARFHPACNDEQTQSDALGSVQLFIFPIAPTKFPDFPWVSVSARTY